MEKQESQDSILMDCYKFYEEIEKQQNQESEGNRASVAIIFFWQKKYLPDSTLQFHILQKNPVKDFEVRKAFQTWKNIKIWLKFKQTQDVQKAHIKIKYGPANQSDYSYLGLDNLTLSKKNGHTMNLSFNKKNKEAYLGTILHEIGHAIGLQHQHQNPFGDIKWNERNVRQHYRKYSEQTIQDNILRPAQSKEEAWVTSIDKESIMIYDFKIFLKKTT